MARPAAPSYIGVDIGTTSGKAVVIDATGSPLASATRTYELSRERVGEVTANPSAWSRAMLELIAECASAAQVLGFGVVGISVTAPAHYAVLLDVDGQPLGRVLLASDARPQSAATALVERYGPALFDATWCQLGPSWTIAQLAWWRTQLSATDWLRLRNVLLPKDYLRLVLTGSAATDASDAAGTGMWDQRNARWLIELCDDLDIPLYALPEVRTATAVAGGLLPEIASVTGVLAGTPIYIGATDTAAELISLGAIRDGDGLVKIASTGTVVVVCGSPHPDPRILTYPHPAPGTWYCLGATNTAATAYGWLTRLMGRDDAEARANLEQLAEDARALADGLVFLPFLEGERTPYWDAELRGAFFGLSSTHGAGSIARAVMEGVAMSLGTVRDVLESLELPLLVEPWFTGGGMASPLWRRITASTLGAPGRFTTAGGSAIGAALLARAGSEADGNLHNIVTPRQYTAVQPDQTLTDLYTRSIPVYEAAVAAALLWRAVIAGASQQGTGTL